MQLSVKQSSVCLRDQISKCVRFQLCCNAQLTNGTERIKCEIIV